MLIWRYLTWASPSASICLHPSHSVCTSQRLRLCQRSLIIRSHRHKCSGTLSVTWTPPPPPTSARRHTCMCTHVTARQVHCWSYGALFHIGVFEVSFQPCSRHALQQPCRHTAIRLTHTHTVSYQVRIFLAQMLYYIPLCISIFRATQMMFDTSLKKKETQASSQVSEMCFVMLSFSRWLNSYVQQYGHLKQHKVIGGKKKNPKPFLNENRRMGIPILM